MKNLSEEIAKTTGSTVLTDEPLSKYTTYKIGGPADILVMPNSPEDLIRSLQIINKENIPLFVMGKGSNLLISDNGIRGAVIRIAGTLNEITFNNNIVKAGSGTYLKTLILACAENGLSGMEFFIGIPATIGGAVAMNAGAWSASLSHLIKNITAVSKQGKTKKFSKHECNFVYRGSDFLTNGMIITEVELELKKDDPQLISSRQEKLLEMKASSQPVGYPSAGCVFKNPQGNSAGKLIEDAGLKGEKIGGAQVSEIHANFIINAGGATAKDVMSLINRIKGIVFEKFNIELELEIQTLGF